LVWRGSAARHRIVYESCAVVPGGRLAKEAERLLGLPRVEYLHVRARTSTCYQCRIERV
jgi:hypothetical protein